MSFGDRLRARRISVNLTQEKLGKIVGLKKATISSLELGASKKPSAENLLPLAKALNVDPHWLITGKGDIEPSKAELDVHQDALNEHEMDLLLNYRGLDKKHQKLAIELIKTLKKL